MVTVMDNGTHPVLQKDNVATVVMAKFNIKASYFNRKECADPVPTMISTNPEETIRLAINGFYGSPWTMQVLITL